jgi:hypothetical protein
MRATSASRRRMLACSVPLLANSVRTSRTVCASCDSARSSARRASLGSRRTSGWPALTMSVSSTSTASTVPPTCGVTCTIGACT